MARRFTRSEPRSRAVEYLRGLLSGVERKNGWQLAEHAGVPSPYGVQYLTSWAGPWEADRIRDDLVAYVRECLADPKGVLIVDETGTLNKGTKSAGMQRQHSGTAGRIENCQVGVFLTFAGRGGHALLNRELYLPKDWAADAERRKEARIPEEVEVATKPRLAERMLERAWKAGVAAAWVTGDAVYGDDVHFRRALESKGQPYVLAVKSDQMLFDGRWRDRVDSIADRLPARSWRKLGAGAGSEGPRWYDWAAESFVQSMRYVWPLRQGRSVLNGKVATARTRLAQTASQKVSTSHCARRTVHGSQTRNGSQPASLRAASSLNPTFSAIKVWTSAFRIKPPTSFGAGRYQVNRDGSGFAS
nr:IS701 family transposase [Paludisphaera mucosa]